MNRAISPFLFVFSNIVSNNKNPINMKNLYMIKLKKWKSCILSSPFMTAVKKSGEIIAIR